MYIFGPDHYVPVLKCKRGEKKALELLPPKVKDKLTPVLEVVENKDKNPLDAHLDTAFRKLPVAVGSRPFFLDARELEPMGSRAAVAVFERATTLSLNFVPVTGISRGFDVSAAISNAHRGICIRVTKDEYENGTLRSGLQAFIRRYRLPENVVDIVLDMGPLEDMVVSGAARLAQGMIRSLPTPQAWRTVTIVGTSFPKSMQIVDRNSSKLVDRVEWLCWRDKIYAGRKGLTRLPSFGDCVIQHPLGVEGFNPRFMQVSAAIRYTVGDQWLLIKGESTEKVPAKVQFPRLAWELVQGTYSGYFYGRHHCEGCEGAWSASQGLGSYGSAEVWRRLGTIHHLLTTATQISSLIWP
jgi:hypothetical protein